MTIDQRSGGSRIRLETQPGSEPRKAPPFGSAFLQAPEIEIMGVNIWVFIFFSRQRADLLAGHAKAILLPLFISGVGLHVERVCMRVTCSSLVTCPAGNWTLVAGLISDSCAGEYGTRTREQRPRGRTLRQIQGLRPRSPGKKMCWIPVRFQC